MLAKCIDNSHTWRNVLTIGESYDVIKIYNNKHDLIIGIDVKCDDGVVRPYDAKRFIIDESLT